MTLDLLNELRAKYGVQDVPAMQRIVDPEAGREEAFLVDARGSDGKLRTVLTGPVREVAQVNEGFTYLRGRYVEADKPNGNGALWTSSDLETGQRTVAGGPLNWLHQERKIIGTLLDGSLQPGREAADDEPAIGAHIVSNAVVWRFLFPQETYALERAAQDGQLYYSMECLSKEVACGSCEDQVPYGDYDAGRCCEHLQQKTGTRRFVDPYFLGGAVIVPPVKPGWANASVDVMRQAAELTEAQGIGGDRVSEQQAREMVGAILEWAGR